MDAFRIPISDDAKRDIYQAVKNGLLDMDEFVSRENLSFQNGFPQLKWAFIFNRLYHDFQFENGEVLRGKRGPWPLVMIYDEYTSYVYVVLKKKNFNLIQKNLGKKKVPHYLEALSTYNNGIEKEIDPSQIEQYQLQLDFNIDQESMDKVLLSLLGNLKGQIKRLVVVTFEGTSKSLDEINALIPNSNLDILYLEDWSKFIEVDYTVAEGYGDHHESEQDDILLTFNDDAGDTKDQTGQ